MRYRSILAPVILLLALIQTSIAQVVPPGEQGTSPQAADKPGAIKGRVVAADTGAGLRRARVMLRGSESRPGMNPQTSQTNENGEYEIKDVKPGRYTLDGDEERLCLPDLWTKINRYDVGHDVAHARHAAHRPSGRNIEPGELSDDPRRSGGGADHRSKQ